MAVAVIAKGGSGLCGPAFTGDGRLLCCGSQDGTIYLEDSGSLLPFASTSGCPMGTIVDHTGSVFVCDTAHAAVLVSRPSDAGHGMATLIDQYEGRPLMGPNSGTFDSAGQLFFTDSGPFGETNLERRKGAVYCVSGEGTNRILRPLVADCLAYPTGIALSGEEQSLLVCEMAANRILRAVQRPSNVWHFHAWHQFNGRLGPVAIVCDAARGLVYVARAEFKELSSVGMVSVLSMEGELLKDIPLQGYPELSGMALTPDNSALILTEASTNTVLRVQL